MEYEKKFWIRSRVPTGLGGWPKKKKRKIVSEESYEYIKQLSDEGKSLQEIANLMGCSWVTIRKIKETL